MNDTKGDTIGISGFGPKDEGYDFFSQATKYMFRNPKNDGVFAVSAHDNRTFMRFSDKTPNDDVYTPKEFNDRMSVRSIEWKNAMQHGKKITLIIYSCEVGGPAIRGKNGKCVANFAKQISAYYHNVKVIAVDGDLDFNYNDKGHPVPVGISQDPWTAKGERKNSLKWTVYKRGQFIQHMNFKPMN